MFLWTEEEVQRKSRWWRWRGGSGELAMGKAGTPLALERGGREGRCAVMGDVRAREDEV